MELISGFSKLNKKQKIEWLADFFESDKKEEIQNMSEFWHQDNKNQKLFDEFSENTLTNYFLPYGIAPNFIIDNEVYAIPMVIEESSVVAAASKAAKFWSTRGGFKTKIFDIQKVGHVHFFWYGKKELLEKLLVDNKDYIVKTLRPITANMENRGGGILDIKLKDLSHKLDHFFQFELTFNTCDAMGANFINSILEETAKIFQSILRSIHLADLFELNMCILSNYTPDCLVEASVECSYEKLTTDVIDGKELAKKLKRAVDIAKVDKYRAVTHNKGIFNGIDAVVLATGNDFRAIEACGHAYAARGGEYKSLTSVELSEDTFKFKIQIPLSLGTVGGLTALHPLAKKSLMILGNPSAKKLMSIIASVGLAQNFSAINSLVTTGIQKGHMKMHLLNILKQLKASDVEINEAKKFFEDKIVSFTAVRNFLSTLKYKQ